MMVDELEKVVARRKAEEYWNLYSKAVDAFQAAVTGKAEAYESVDLAWNDYLRAKHILDKLLLRRVVMPMH
jgi:hypothetical protein